MNNTGEPPEQAAQEKFGSHMCPLRSEKQSTHVSPFTSRSVKVWVHTSGRITEMRGRRYRLIVTRVEYGAPVAARCSVCDRLFEVSLDALGSIANANQELGAMFEDHTCA